MAVAMKYDYILVVGPGRSGSEFLYENLRRHPRIGFPEIKEGYYYRSLRAYKRARGRLGKGVMLADIANLAYNDARLPEGARALQSTGERVLLVVLLRPHRERAASMMRFRRSRGERTALLGARRLEAAVVADRLTADDLARIYAIEADALTLDFEALTGDAAGALAALYSQCGIEQARAPVAQAVNQSERARFLPLTALGKAAALLLRRLGCRRLLQRVKDSAAVRRALFAPPAEGASDARLSAEAEATLSAAYAECRAAVEAASERVGEGVYLRRAGATEKAVA